MNNGVTKEPTHDNCVAHPKSASPWTKNPFWEKTQLGLTVLRLLERPRHRT